MIFSSTVRIGLISCFACNTIVYIIYRYLHPFHSNSCYRSLYLCMHLYQQGRGAKQFNFTWKQSNCFGTQKDMDALNHILNCSFYIEVNTLQCVVSVQLWMVEFKLQRYLRLDNMNVTKWEFIWNHVKGRLVLFYISWMMTDCC